MGERGNTFRIYPEDWEIMETLSNEELGVLIKTLVTTDDDTDIRLNGHALYTAYVAVRILHRLIPDEG